MRLYSKSRLSESINIPFEGIFWVIDDELIALKDSVNPNNPYDCTDLLHRDSWKYIKDKYTVNSKTVNYDYFPRGRVETLVIQDRTLTSVAKRNMKGIVPLAYNLRKAKGEQLNSDNLYNGMIHAYTGGNIGPISNNITKVWNSNNKISEEQLNVVRWLCMENNQVI